MDSKYVKALLAVDGSEHSQAIVNYIGNILSPKNTRITLFHVTKAGPRPFWDFDHDADEGGHGDVFDGWEKIQKSNIRMFMEDSIDSLTARGFEKSNIDVLIRPRKYGVASDIEHAASDGYDLVAVGRWGHSRLTDLAFGGVTHKIMGKIKDRTVCIVAEKPENKKILLAVDATDSSLKAIKFASMLAQNEQVEIEIFHAVRRLTLPPYIVDMPGVEDGLERLIKAERDHIIPVMEQARDTLISNGVDEGRIRKKIVTGVESRAEAIVKEAREKGFDGIVLGRRRMTRSEEFYVGRVGDKVFQLARKRAIFIVG